MGAYKHILLASNLLEGSKKIGDRAKQLADRSKAKLSIVHVVEFNPIIYGGGEFAIPLDGDLEQSVHNNAKKALEVEGKRLNIPSDNQYLQSGVTAENLMDLVKTIKADLLVLGHQERHWFITLLGSISNSLLHVMPCDVLVVLFQ